MNITVIMPVFNAEKYISDAIESLLNQSCPNWELLCIDDGSTDNSTQIIRHYSNLDYRIKLIKQENSGPGVARANAIKLAETEYISILDADDAYSKDYIEKMLAKAEETYADIIVPDVVFGYGNTKKLPNMFTSNNLSSDIIINNGEEAFALTFPWKLHGWIMIKTTLAKKFYTVNNLSYSKYNSDEYITRLLYLKSTKTALCDAKYQYRIAPDSITRKPSLKKLDYFKTLDILIDLCKKEGMNKSILLHIYNDYYISIINMLKIINLLSIDEQKKGHTIIKEMYYKSYRAKFDKNILIETTWRTKIKFYLSLKSFLFFKLITL